MRRLAAGEVDLHRRLRLRALREAPDSFGESFAESAARPWSRALLDAVFGWARESGFTQLGLWAPAHRPAALALYRGAGFQETGRRRPLRADSALEIVEMEADVGAAGPPPTC